MRLTLNDIQIPLLPAQEIGLQENSPLTELKQKGDKSHNFAIKNSKQLRTALAGTLHAQSKRAPGNLTAALYEGPLKIFNGTAAVKRSNADAVEISITVPPGDISSTFWKSKLRELDLGNHALDTYTILEPIYVIKSNTIGENQTDATQTLFGTWYMATGTTLRIKMGSQAIFTHFFEVLGYDFDQRRAAALAGLQAAAAAYNANPVLANTQIFAAEAELTIVLAQVNGSLNIELYHNPMAAGSNGFPTTHLFENVQAIGHETAKTTLLIKGSKPSIAEGAAEYLWFPTVFAPEYYSGKSDRYNGSINARDGGNLQANDFSARLNFPLSPAFRWLYLIDLLLEKQGYTRNGEWSTWQNFALMAMVDFSRQHPDTMLPYNIYPTTMNVATYLPDWTVQEFFDEFMLQTGNLLIWDLNNKTLSLKTWNAILGEEAQLMPEGEFIENSYDEIKTYALKYNTLESKELINDEIKAYFGAEDNYEEKTTIPQNAVPLAVLPSGINDRAGVFSTRPQDRANGTYIGVLKTITADSPRLFIQSIAKSEILDLKNNEPIPRLLFLNGFIATTEDQFSLARTGPISITEVFLKPLLASKTGRITKVKFMLRPLDYLKINFQFPLFYLGNKYLATKKDSKMKNGQLKQEVILEMELLL
jgi:hypothetical protein